MKEQDLAAKQRVALVLLLPLLIEVCVIAAWAIQQ